MIIPNFSHYSEIIGNNEKKSRVGARAGGADYALRNNENNRA